MALVRAGFGLYHVLLGRDQLRPAFTLFLEQLDLARLLGEELLALLNGTPLQYFAWKIPWTEEPGGLQSMESLGVGHD